MRHATVCEMCWCSSSVKKHIFVSYCSIQTSAIKLIYQIKNWRERSWNITHRVDFSWHFYINDIVEILVVASIPLKIGQANIGLPAYKWVNVCLEWFITADVIDIPRGEFDYAIEPSCDYPSLFENDPHKQMVHLLIHIIYVYIHMCFV